MAGWGGDYSNTESEDTFWGIFFGTVQLKMCAQSLASAHLFIFCCLTDNGVG